MTFSWANTANGVALQIYFLKKKGILIFTYTKGCSGNIYGILNVQTVEKVLLILAASFALFVAD